MELALEHAPPSTVGVGRPSKPLLPIPSLQGDAWLLARNGTMFFLILEPELRNRVKLYILWMRKNSVDKYHGTSPCKLCRVLGSSRCLGPSKHVANISSLATSSPHESVHVLVVNFGEEIITLCCWCLVKLWTCLTTFCWLGFSCVLRRSTYGKVYLSCCRHISPFVFHLQYSSSELINH